MLRKHKKQKKQEVGGSQVEDQADELSAKLKGLNTSDATDVDAFEREKEKKRAQRAQYDEDLTDGKARPLNNTAANW